MTDMGSLSFLYLNGIHEITEFKSIEYNHLFYETKIMQGNSLHKCWSFNNRDH